MSGKIAKAIVALNELVYAAWKGPIHIEEAMKRKDIVEAVLTHIHMQNNDDLNSTACAECGLDLRNPIHTRAHE